MKTTSQETPQAVAAEEKGAKGLVVMKPLSQKPLKRCSAKDVELDPIDVLAIGDLSALFKNAVPMALFEVCIQRHLLPASLGHSLAIAPFLCRWLQAVKISERATGIRFSILLAEAWHAPNPDNPLFGVWNCFAVPHGSFGSLEDCLLDHAQDLAESPKFKGVMRAMKNPQECLRQISLCELWNVDERQARVDFILENDLQDCVFVGSEAPLSDGKAG